MIPKGERGFLFTPPMALALFLFLLSVSYLSFHGRESGYLIRSEYIKPVINEAILSVTHQELSRSVYLGIADFMNGANLPGGETNGYRYGRIAVHQGGNNIEWIGPDGLLAPYKIVDVGSLRGDDQSYKTVIESMRYYIDYELAKLAVDVHNTIKKTQGADVWVVPRCYVNGEDMYWDFSNPNNPKIILRHYEPSDPSRLDKTPIVPDADDPFTIYVHVDVHLMAQIPGWEILDLDLGETTVTTSIQGYAPTKNDNKAVFDPLPLWAYYASENEWGGDSPLKFKPMIVPSNYQISVGKGGSLGGQTITQSDAVKFYTTYYENGSTSEGDRLRLAHVLSLNGKMLPWDDTKVLDWANESAQESAWAILPYFPVKWGDAGRPPNFIERAAGILYVLPDGVVSIDGKKDVSSDAIWSCQTGMETLIPTLPAKYADVWSHGPYGTVDWMAWMEVLASRSYALENLINNTKTSDLGAPNYLDDSGEPLRAFWLYGFNSSNATVYKINDLLASAGFSLATDADRRKGFAIPGVDVLRFHDTVPDLVFKNDRAIRVWP